MNEFELPDNLSESIIREETQKLPVFILRRVTEKKLDKLIKDVRKKIRLGFKEDEAIYDEVRNFIAWEFLEVLNRDFPREQDYWDFYMKLEKPLVDLVKTKLH
jgi:hypothetical protein